MSEKNVWPYYGKENCTVCYFFESCIDSGYDSVCAYVSNRNTEKMSMNSYEACDEFVPIIEFQIAMVLMLL